MNTLGLLTRMAERAGSSRFHLWLLNHLLYRVIPFNRPHGFRLVEIGSEHVKTSAPWRRRNHNHIRGVHACAIATIAEFSAGFLLLTRLDPRRYRLIMAGIQMDYHYQAKARIISESRLPDRELERSIMPRLDRQGVALIRIESRIVDVYGNQVATGVTSWQVKTWNQVRTSV